MFFSILLQKACSESVLCQASLYRILKIKKKKKNCQEKQTSKNFRGYVQKINYFIKPELL